MWEQAELERGLRQNNHEARCIRRQMPLFTQYSLHIPNHVHQRQRNQPVTAQNPLKLFNISISFSIVSGIECTPTRLAGSPPYQPKVNFGFSSTLICSTTIWSYTVRIYLQHVHQLWRELFLIDFYAFRKRVRSRPYLPKLHCILSSLQHGNEIWKFQSCYTSMPAKRKQTYWLNKRIIRYIDW